MVRLVLFDIDGTLIRTGGAGVRAFGRACEAEFGIADAIARLNFSGRTDYSVYAEFLEQNGLKTNREATERFFASYIHWLALFLTETRGEICPGAQQFLSELAMLPSPPLLGLLTGNIRLGAEIKLRHYELWDHFRLGAFGDDHADRNQLAHIARGRGIEMLGTELRGEEILVIGDTPLDIECARAIGARMLAVATGNVPHNVLQEHHPTWLVQDLRQISAVSAVS